MATQQTKFLGMKFDSKRTPFLLLIVTACLCLFELFSYHTSYTAMMSLIGIEAWSKYIAIGFTAVDFAGFAKLMGKDAAETLGTAMKWLWAVWILTALGDTFLTFYSIHVGAATREPPVMVTAGVISMEAWNMWIPAFIACIVFLVQTGLVKQLDDAITTLSEAMR